MDKLLNVHREGGYPLVGENLKIIEDWPRYIEATLNGLMIPSLTCVILDTGTSGVLNPPSIICYIASDSIADRGLYELHLPPAQNVNIPQLVNGDIQKGILIEHTTYDVTNAQGVFNNVYKKSVATITPVSGVCPAYKFKYLHVLLQELGEIDYAETALTAACYSHIEFDTNGTINANYRLDNHQLVPNPDFHTVLKIKKHTHCFVQLSYKAVGTDAVYSVITLPPSFALAHGHLVFPYAVGDGNLDISGWGANNVTPRVILRGRYLIWKNVVSMNTPVHISINYFK